MDRWGIRATAWRYALVVLGLMGLPGPALACTSFLITKGASVDGSSMVTYAADSHELYGALYHTPAAMYPPGTMLKVIEWDTGKYLGEIPQVAETFNVVGNMNQHQVAIGETTWGGRESLHNPQGRIDYGSLIYITLQRAKTAQDAIRIMTQLVAEHGYCSTGESFSIADPEEVWLLEMIGKGPGRKGAVWVARRVPDGYISAHANAARIRQFPLHEPETTWYAPDVISFAREQGYYTGPDDAFSFADAYAPADFGSARFCDGRVWCMYRRAAPSQKIPADWVQGRDGSEPVPLWIRPDKKLSLADVMGFMRDHFEGTEFDMTKDVGAGPYDLPYRWRPLTFKVDDQEYLHERAVSTQQTGFSFVSQSRGNLPDEIGGVLWFGVDDTYSTVYFPAYCGITRIPRGFAVGQGSFHEFRWDSAFWVFNFVSNFSYLRYRDMIRDVQQVQQELEGRFLAEQPAVDQAAVALYRQSPRLAADYLTDYSVQAGDDVVTRWRKLGEFLLYKYLDGNVKDELGNVTHPGYPDSWYQKVAKAGGDHLKVLPTAAEKERSATQNAKDAAQAKELASAVLLLLESRKIPVTEADRTRIEECTDSGVLQGWLVNAAHAASCEECLKDKE